MWWRWGPWLEHVRDPFLSHLYAMFGSQLRIFTRGRYFREVGISS